tara:strand:+ start:123 stop:323 length:201 start_codon:yes stop_codon:yes gene_type:complete
LIVNKQILVVHPAWMILFLTAYVFAFYVFFKTEGNIFLAAFSLCTWMIGSSAILYWYYGIPFSGGL